MSTDNLQSIVLAGPAGKGVRLAGQLLAAWSGRGGYLVLGYPEYPSLIKGGVNSYQLFYTTQPELGFSDQFDLGLAIDLLAVQHLVAKGLAQAPLICAQLFELPVELNSVLEGQLFWLPVKVLEPETRRYDNILLLGAAAAFQGIDLKLAQAEVASLFKNKGDSIVQANQASLAKGYHYLLENWPELQPKIAPKAKLKPVVGRENSVVLTGNEALSLGALAAGCQFLAAYPMTPATSILHYLAARAAEFELVVKHSSDEIAAINEVLGAAVAGLRSFTCTAGGGFALMVESFGFAAIAEIPLVVVVGQRPGPATGMPTWTSQADLGFVLNPSPDEYPFVLLTPGDLIESFESMGLAFNLAEKYQLPVIVLVDKYLAENHFTVAELPFDQVTIDRGKLIAKTSKDYQRYVFSADGVSPRALPGFGEEVQLINSYEHDQSGFATEDPEMRVKMMTKRMKKSAVLAAELPALSLAGNQDYPLVLVGFGSTKETIKVVAQRLKVACLHFNYLVPFPQAEVIKLLAGKQLVVIEGNYQGQLAKLIRQETGLVSDSILQYNGRPFSVDYLIDKLVTVEKYGLTD